MGHVQPGGEAEPQAPGPLTPQEAAYWPVWRRLCREFPTWSFVFSAILTPAAWRTIVNDLVSGLRANRSTKRAFQLTAGLSDEDIEALAAIAALNQRRHDWVMRILIVVYLTIPATLATLAAEVMGDGLISVLREQAQASAALIVGLVIAILIYFMAQWRARQMVGVLELIRIDRGLPARD